MADRSSCSLAIGGTIRSRKALRELAEAIEADGWGLDWDGAPDDWEAHIAGVAEAGDCLMLTAHDYAGGGFDSAARDLATKLKLCWTWSWDGCAGAYSGGVTAFRPDVAPEPLEVGGGDDGGPCIALSTIQAWMAEGRLAEQVELYGKAFGPTPSMVVKLPARKRPQPEQRAAAP